MRVNGCQKEEKNKSIRKCYLSFDVGGFLIRLFNQEKIQNNNWANVVNLFPDVNPE